MAPSKILGFRVDMKMVNSKPDYSDKRRPRLALSFQVNSPGQRSDHRKCLLLGRSSRFLDSFCGDVHNLLGHFGIVFPLG
jgi:hypothetical protein